MLLQQLHKQIETIGYALYIAVTNYVRKYSNDSTQTENEDQS